MVGVAAPSSDAAVAIVLFGSRFEGLKALGGRVGSSLKRYVITELKAGEFGCGSFFVCEAHIWSTRCFRLRERPGDL